MEQRKNEINILLIFIIIILIILCILFATNTITIKSNKETNNQQNEEKIDTNNQQNEEKIETTNTTTNNNYKLDLNVLNNYKNYTNDYGTIYTYGIDNPNIIIRVGADGKVSVSRDNAEQKYITNLNDVILFVEPVGYGMGTNTNCYFLTSTGDVYSYDIFEKSLEAKKLDVSNIRYIYNYSFNNVHGSESSEMLLGINNKGETIIIN